MSSLGDGLTLASLSLNAVLLGVSLYCLLFLRRKQANERSKIHAMSESHTEVVSQLSQQNAMLQLDLERYATQAEREVLSNVIHNALDDIPDDRAGMLREVIIPSSSVTIERMLGKGGNGEVFRAKYKDKTIAVKRITRIDTESIERFRHECFLMKGLRHPNIVRLIGVCWDEKLVGCCLEYVSNGSLEDWLRSDFKRVRQNHRTAYGNAQSQISFFDVEPSGKEEYPSALRNSNMNDLNFFEKKMGSEDVLSPSLSPEDMKLKKRHMKWGRMGFQEAIYTGWKPPLESAYLPEDVELVDKVHKIVTEKHQSCLDGTDGWIKAAPLKSFKEELNGYTEEAASSFHPYVRMVGGKKGIWEVLITYEVDMRPDQYIASQLHNSNNDEDNDIGSWIGVRNEFGYRNLFRGRLELPFLQPRELIYKGVSKHLGKHHYAVAAESIDHPLAKDIPGVKRGIMYPCGELYIPILNDVNVAYKTKVIRYNCAHMMLPGLLNLLGNAKFVMLSARYGVASPFNQKLVVEKALADYRPLLPNGLSWNDQLIGIMNECASVMQYLHQARYYSEEDGAYRECIIHRDLKPDNMLLTRGFSLKMADFGESRALEQGQTMSFVGSPMYIAPEVMKNERYSEKVDTYAFGWCLVACIRAEKNLSSFLMESLRKSMGKKSMFGIGMFMLNNKVLNKKWRPKLPNLITKCYPQLTKLIHDCWQDDPKARPDFDDIVRRMPDIRVEIAIWEEPVITPYSLEDDTIYQEQENSGCNLEEAPSPPRLVKKNSMSHSFDRGSENASLESRMETVKLMAELEEQLQKEKDLVAELTKDRDSCKRIIAKLMRTGNASPHDDTFIDISTGSDREQITGSGLGGNSTPWVREGDNRLPRRTSPMPSRSFRPSESEGYKC
jgi:serine/threonine protein kinase